MMLHYLNSGLWRFKLDKIDTPRCHHEIQQEIRNEIPSAIEVEEMLHRCFKLRGMSHISQNNDISNKAPIYACGVCGICLPERGNWQFQKVNVLQLKSFALLSDDTKTVYKENIQKYLYLPIDNEESMSKFYPYQAQSVYKSKLSNDTYYHLHPELVQLNDNKSEKYTYLCPTCKGFISKKTPSPLSIANGVDFGNYNRIGLVKPNPMEITILSHLRMFHSIFKIQNNQKNGTRANFTGSKIKSHVILFPHESPQIAPLSLLLQRDTLSTMVENVIQFEFVGPSDEIDQLMMHTHQTASITARPHVLYQWFSILMCINPLYQNQPPLPSYEEFHNVVTDLNKLLQEKAMKVTSSESLEAEPHLGDDVAQQNTHIRGQHNLHGT